MNKTMQSESLGEAMNQKQLVLHHLKTNGHITPLEALSKLGVYRLSDSILKLRRDGHSILTYRIEAINRLGKVCEYAKYQLVEDNA